jgi:ATP-binding cassette subfamily B (MDR/TAP) protein 1
MIMTAFGIGFTKSWTFTLVVGTTIPYMFFITMILSAANSKLEVKQREIYARAAVIAEEALSSILNITALGTKTGLSRSSNALSLSPGRIGFGSDLYRLPYAAI